MRLEDYKKKDLFSTPEGYFGELEKKVADKTIGNRSSVIRKKRTLVIGNRIYRFGYAALILIIATVAFTVANRETPASTQSQTAQTESTAKEPAVNHETDYEYDDMLLASYPIDEYTFYCYMTDTE